MHLCMTDLMHVQTLRIQNKMIYNHQNNISYTEMNFLSALLINLNGINKFYVELHVRLINLATYISLEKEIKIFK